MALIRCGSGTEYPTEVRASKDGNSSKIEFTATHDYATFFVTMIAFNAAPTGISASINSVAVSPTEVTECASTQSTNGTKTYKFENIKKGDAFLATPTGGSFISNSIMLAFG